MCRNSSLIIVLALAALFFLPSLALADDAESASSPILLTDDDEAEAQDADSDTVAADEANDEANEADKKADKTPSESPVKGHGLQLSMSFLGIPGYIFDHWFSEHGNVWQGDAVNMGFSLDYFLRFKAPCEMRFSLSWANAATGDAYWLDERYSNKPQLADWIENNHSIISLEIAAYHIVSITDQIAFYYGGGIWGGLILDGSKSYAIRESCAKLTDDISTCPHEPGSVPLTQVPAGFGFVMVTLGFKFTVLDIMTIRAEGGFKGYFYGQVGVGVEF
ncbi:MAG: hypothetical protein IJU23_12470 [Proteobacteria bacterium]|nr:hypothetical protein [Pseudomonadota bacterium]